MSRRTDQTWKLKYTNAGKAGLLLLIVLLAASGAVSDYFQIPVDQALQTGPGTGRVLWLLVLLAFPIAWGLDKVPYFREYRGDNLVLSSMIAVALIYLAYFVL